MNFKRISILLIIVGVIAALVTSAYTSKAGDDSSRKLVGTWLCDIPGEAPFQALQTFYADGTFTETSSLLGMREEGPAHGVWSRQGKEYLNTFYLFAFDKDTGEHTGMFRVRLSLRLDSPDHFTTTYSALDFIDLDGNIIELVPAGPGGDTCSRLSVVPVQ